MIFSIKIADEIYTIETKYPDTKKLCHDYLNEEEGKLIQITQDDIEQERLNVFKEAMIEGCNPPYYSDGELETTAVYRKIADDLSYKDGAVFHGAFIEYKGDGYLFTAVSGTGKTTHINNWLKCFKEARVINGDKPILRMVNDQLIGYGTPWSGKEGMNTNASVPVKAIISLHRSKENEIEKVTFKTMFTKLLAAIYRPKDEGGMKRVLELIMKLNETTYFYELGCNMDQESAIVAYQGISGNQ